MSRRVFVAAVLAVLALTGAAVPASAAADGPAPASHCYFSDNTIVPIPDGGPPVVKQFTVPDGCSHGTVTSSIVIRHPYRGDLKVELILPDGSIYVLKWPNPSDSGDDYLGSHTINLGSSPAAGIWRLRVTDVYQVDAGYIQSWILDF
jgi:subtilisin-like proprotein convertase family protein